MFKLILLIATALGLVLTPSEPTNPNPPVTAQGDPMPGCPGPGCK